MSEADQGSVISAQPGDEIEICLHEKPSGGYRWLPADVADHVEPAEQQVSYAPGMVGGTSTARLVFRVKSAGRGPITLRYGRPWEAGDSALEAWQVTIDSQ